MRTTTSLIRPGSVDEVNTAKQNNSSVSKLAYFRCRTTKNANDNDSCTTDTVASENLPSESISGVPSNDRDNFYRLKDMERRKGMEQRNTLCKILKCEKANLLEMWVSLVKDINYCYSGNEVSVLRVVFPITVRVKFESLYS